MSPKSIKSSTNVGKKLCVKTCLFLTLIFMDFRCILAPKLALKKVGFFEVFLKLAPEGSQEASKRLRKAPKRPPRSDLKRFLLSFWTVLGIVLGKTSRATRYFHHALQPYKRVWEIRSYVLCSFFFLRCFYAFQFFATFTFSDFSWAFESFAMFSCFVVGGLRIWLLAGTA